MPPGRKRKVEQVDTEGYEGPGYTRRQHECPTHSTPKTGSASVPKPDASSSKRKGKEKASVIQESEASKPRKKRVRKNNDLDTPVQEKRAAMFKRACPKNISERVARVREQRFFMIDRKREGKELREEFSVLGSTGNVYTVVIDKLPDCDCPDARKGNHCKHILFIFLKVLQVPESSHIWYQKALLTSELGEIFQNAPTAPNAMADPRVRDAFARATGKMPDTQDLSSQSTKKRIPGEDDDCPICYEGLFGVSEGDLTWCETCGNSIHNPCFQQWARTKGSDLTCVFCRAKWSIPGGSGKSTLKEGYINLSNAAGISNVRDTSTYYRRGRGYQGHYQDYEFDD